MRPTHVKLSLLLLAFATTLLSACNPVAPTLTATSNGGATTSTLANLTPFTDSTGTFATYTTLGSIDLTSPFFQSLGTNGRTCGTCHQAAQGMSLTPTAATALFASTNGTDPLFAAVDGANYPTAPTGDAASHSLLLNNGLIRIAETLPAGTQFTITCIHDPYNIGLVTDPATGRPTVSVYRRPLPSTSLPYLSAVMWDTRETVSPLTTASTFSAALNADLTQQLLDAITTHAQGTAVPTAAQQASILQLEQSLFTAQSLDNAAGSLTAAGAQGGPTNLAAQSYYPGINDAFGGDPTGAAFNPAVFTLYGKWNNSSVAAQASIARGQGVFNNAPINITNVRGINDNTALGSPASVKGSCATCHDAPNLGHHSVPLPMDTATSRIAADETNNGIIAGLGQIAAPALPIFQITGCKDANNHPVTYTTTDPGKALLTGQCADVNRVKVPLLRGLAARAPYFHNGSAANLQQLVNFYDSRFGMGLTPAQKTDLINFLNAL